MSYTKRPTDVLLRNVRLSYVRFDKAYAKDARQEKKYSCTILLPKTELAQKQAIDNAIAAAIARGREKYGSAVPERPKTPIWDGDGYSQSGKAFGAEAKGHWVFTAGLPEAMAKGPVEVVDLGHNPILNRSEIYSGMYANVLVNFFFYRNESIGVGAGLGPVQKVADGDPLGVTIPSADDVFGAPGAAVPADAGLTYAAGAPTAYVKPQVWAQTGVPAAVAATQCPVNPLTGAPL